MAEQRSEPAAYSPMSATTAAVDILTALREFNDDSLYVRELAEICYVINALAGMLGCPGNQSVEDFRIEHTTRKAT